MLKGPILAVLGILILTLSPLAAHHGPGNFDLLHPITIEGTVVSIVWANPHVVMTVRTQDATIYHVTWQGTIQGLSLMGISRTTFKAGDDLIITAAPSRDSKLHELQKVQAVRRPSDGWRWSSAS